MASGEIAKNRFPYLSHEESVTISGNQTTVTATHDGWAYISGACTAGNFVNLNNTTKGINLYDTNYESGSTKTMTILAPCSKGDSIIFRITAGTILSAKFFY